MIKAIFFDIDGTLVAHGANSMPASTLKALNYMKEKGIKLFIATGRPPNSISHVQAMFDFDGYLCANGQYIFNKEGVIFEKYINNDSFKTLIPYLEENHIPVTVAKLDKSYRNIKCEDQYENQFPIINLHEIENEPIVQIMAYIKEDDDQAFLNHLPGCKSARWTPAFADIIPSDGGKDIGINHMIAHYGISLDEVMAFGDGGNDITMLKHVPCSVAMGNAEDRVKENASYVTSHINEDGIAKALIHFGVLAKDFLD